MTDAPSAEGVGDPSPTLGERRGLAATRSVGGVGGPARPTPWKVHAEVALLLGWGRAILMQLAHPLVAAGVSEHSRFLGEGWGRWRRLHRTLSAMLALTFGPDERVAQVARRINGIHDRVHGRLPEAVGVFAAGTPYSAHDPHLLRWVHATLLDSFLLTYERYVGPLDDAERDRYCAEGTAIEQLLGIPAGFVPASEAALRTYMRAMLGGGQIAVSAAARTLAREVVAPPAPLAARPGLAFMRLVTIGLLPPELRTAYGFPWDARREALFRRSTPVVRAVLRATPPALRQWPAARRRQ